MTYEQAVAELERLGIMPAGMPELGPIRRALARAGLLDRIDPRRNVIVAGTNGKGSVAATLSRLLRSAGQRVGLYTSPHLVTTRERVRVAEEDLSEESFARAYSALAPVIREERLSHFEALTLIAARVFHEASLDWAIWEVGMGGLHDATNAIPHRFCAITRLGLDHQAILGGTLQEIALQKFGVIGEGAVVVHSPMDPALAPLRDEVAARTGCRWIEARPVEELALDRVATPWGEARLNLCGPRAAENTATALTLFEALGFNPRDGLPALTEVRWPGRFSRLALAGFPCPLYLSGDHNPQGARSLIEILSRLRRETLHLVVGIGREKEADAMLEELFALPRARVSLTETPFKPLPLAEYPSRWLARAERADRDVFQLLSCIARDAGPRDLAVVTGSLYLVGEVLARSAPK